MNDFKFAFRMIKSHRWFSAAIIVTLSLGIGVNTTVFTLVNAVMFKPVPLPNGDRLVMLGERNVNDGDQFGMGLSYPDFLDYRNQSESFEHLEAAISGNSVLSEDGFIAERLVSNRITAGLFSMIRTAPILGRGFASNDEKAGAEKVALIAHHVWQNRYAGSLDVIGRSVKVDGSPTTIVGVMPEGFAFPNNQSLWLPFVPGPQSEDRGERFMNVYGVLKEGTSTAQAQSDLNVIGARLTADFPDTHKDTRPALRTFHEVQNGGPIKAMFYLLLGAVGFVLLIACANVANMLLGRAMTRQRELSIRAAVGASRSRIIRQLLVESLLLSAIGGLFGMFLAQFGVHAFDVATRNVGKPFWIEFEMDYVVFGYFAVISIASGLVFGLVPALRASRVDLNSVMKEGSAAAGNRQGGRLKTCLVVAQLALTTILLAGAGMMMRGFMAKQQLNPFVPAEQLVAAEFTMPTDKGERYETDIARQQFIESLLADIARVPGVSQVAAASHLPGQGASYRRMEIEGQPIIDQELAPQVNKIVHTPGYLKSIGLPMLLGRALTDEDGSSGKEATVITQAFAKRHWPNELAVGKRFRLINSGETGPWMTIVGVCGDIVHLPLDRNAPPLAFLPYRQDSRSSMHVVVHASGDPAAIMKPLRDTVQKLDHELPLSTIESLSETLEGQFWHIRVFGALFFVFAMMGLLMAAVGIYAVISQISAGRTREIGIRMALGGTARNILTLVLSRGLWQLGIGLAIGLAGAYASTRIMDKSQLLFRTSATDPLVFITITVLLAGIGLFAIWLPARRAANIDPIEALRNE